MTFDIRITSSKIFAFLGLIVSAILTYLLKEPSIIISVAIPAYGLFAVKTHGETKEKLNG